MRTFLAIGLAAMLLVPGCGNGDTGETPVAGGGNAGGGDSGKAPADDPLLIPLLELAKDEVVKGEKAANTFFEAAAKAKTPEEFAAALSKVAKKWKSIGAELHKVSSSWDSLKAAPDKFNVAVNKIDPVKMRLEQGIAPYLEKWAQADVVQTALREWVAAVESWGQ